MLAGISETRFVQVDKGVGRSISGAVPIEEQIILTVNAVEFVGLMCTPILLEELAIGFLYNEGLIDGMAEVADARVCGSGRCVDVWLRKELETPTLRTITSGCSGGTTFEDLVEGRPPVRSDLHIRPQTVVALMRNLQTAARLYRQSQGIHTSALADEREFLCLAEDVGRHNTLDKIAGICLRQGKETQHHILLTSGRVSSEMLGKAARMGVPLIISRTSPTSLSIELARAWGITLIGYTRGRSFRIYTGCDRIVGLDAEVAGAEPGSAEERLHSGGRALG